MSRAQEIERVIRNRVREILAEGPGDKLAGKIFGTRDARTDLYNAAVDKWSEGEEGSFKFVFTPDGGGVKCSVDVTAQGGADPRAAAELGDLAAAAVKTLTPADWSDVGPSYTYIIPAAVTYKKEETMDLRETWLKNAGLLTEADDPNDPLVKKAKIAAIARGVDYVVGPDTFIFVPGTWKGGDVLILASKNPSIPVAEGGIGTAFKTVADMMAAVRNATKQGAPIPVRVGTPQIVSVMQAGPALLADVDMTGKYAQLPTTIYKNIWVVPLTVG
jgi:hypothetical protein